jgi:Cof subfamily protein (haloacid dehalogenase superfamily)
MKIIFFDIDGTLIGQGTRKMSESTIAAIEKARANGHVCMINTGRARALVGSDIRDQVEFDGFLMGCGTMVEYHNEILLHKSFTEEEAIRIMDGIKRYRIDAILEGPESNYCDGLDKFETDTFRKYIGRLDKNTYTTWDKAVGKFDKFFCYVDNLEHMQEFQEEFSDLLDVIDRENHFFEIVPKGYSKASAIRFMTERLGMNMQDTVAIGDSNNDLPMLECAQTAIAMGNSSKEVLEIADYVTSDCKADGIWNALEWLGVLDN